MAEQKFMPDPKSFMPDPMSTPLGDGTSSATGSNTAPFLPYHDLRQWLEEAKKLSSTYIIVDTVGHQLVVPERERAPKGASCRK